MKRWRRSTSSWTTSACGSRRIGPAAGATGLYMRSARGAVRGAGDGTAQAIAPAHWPAARGGLWRAGKGDWGPARRPLRARGRIPRSVDYWQQAGDNAARRNAHHEAIAALRKALALLATLPESPERTQRELALQLALGELLRATKGVGSPDVGEVYTRAYTLCQQTGEASPLARVLWGLSQFQMTQGQVATAGALAQQLLDLAQRQPDTEFLVEGYF